MFSSLERSVVRSSVIPSAKYCWSGSLLRLTNGSTTIDRRGATRGAPIVVAVAALTPGAVGFVLGPSQTHQAIPAMASTVAIVAEIGRTVLRPRRAEIGTSRIGTASRIGIAAMASGRNAKTRTGRVIFFTA